MPYNWVYQLGYHYKIPVVQIIGECIPESLDELYEKIDEAKKWSRRHHREGVVIKDYKNQVFTKEKIDLPDRPKLKNPNQVRVNYPAMPEEKIIRALQHAFDEVGEENWNDKSIAMPAVAKHISTEAREHNVAPPKNMYWYYVYTPIERITNSPEESIKNETI